MGVGRSDVCHDAKQTNEPLGMESTDGHVEIKIYNNKTANG